MYQFQVEFLGNDYRKINEAKYCGSINWQGRLEFGVKNYEDLYRHDNMVFQFQAGWRYCWLNILVWRRKKSRIISLALMIMIEIGNFGVRSPRAFDICAVTGATAAIFSVNT